MDSCSSVRVIGSAHPVLARAVAAQMNVPFLTNVVGQFSDGEVRIEFSEPLAGIHLLIVQPTHTDRAILELELLADAARRAGAREIVAAIPYFGYARQDRRTRFEPLSGGLLARMFELAGMTAVITLDLHSAALENAFTVPVLNLSPAHLFREAWLSHLDVNNLVIVAPDAGAMARARSFAKAVDNAEIAVVLKERKSPDQCECLGLAGCVQGRPAMIVDDLTSTGGTLMQAAQVLMEHGASHVYASVTHLVNKECLARLANSPIEKVFVTDSLPATVVLKDNAVVAPTAPLFASAFQQQFASPIDLSVDELAPLFRMEIPRRVLAMS